MTAVVTGAADGIGRQVAMLLFRKGYKVYDISRRETYLGWLHHITVDVSDKQALERALDEVYAKEGRVDVLVACAGESLASPAELTHTGDARRIYDVNVWGAIYACNHVLARMKRAGKGRILLVSSMTAVLPVPYLAYYCSSKAALASYACAVHNEARPFGVHVSAVLPGGVKTQFSYKRKKYHWLQHDRRAPGLAKAIHRITQVEQNGSSARRVAADMMRCLAQERPTALVPVGMGMKPGFAALRLLSVREEMALLAKFFA